MTKIDQIVDDAFRMFLVVKIEDIEQIFWKVRIVDGNDVYDIFQIGKVFQMVGMVKMVAIVNRNCDIFQIDKDHWMTKTDQMVDDVFRMFLIVKNVDIVQIFHKVRIVDDSDVYDVFQIFLFLQTARIVDCRFFQIWMEIEIFDDRICIFLV